MMTFDDLNEIEKINQEPNEKVRNQLLTQYAALGESGRELLHRVRREYEKNKK